jgi:hypothetical protein
MIIHHEALPLLSDHHLRMGGEFMQGRQYSNSSLTAAFGQALDSALPLLLAAEASHNFVQMTYRAATSPLTIWDLEREHPDPLAYLVKRPLFSQGNGFDHLLYHACAF